MRRAVRSLAAPRELVRARSASIDGSWCMGARPSAIVRERNNPAIAAVTLTEAGGLPMLLQSRSRCILALKLALAVPALGCAGSAASAQAASPDSATTRAPLAQTLHGPAKIMGEALGEVPLTASQRVRIEAMARDFEARHTIALTARKDLMLALAAQVEAGHIERGALEPKVDAFSSALESTRPADRASLEELHTLLSADQRVAFVDAVQARMVGRQDEGRSHHPLKQWADDLKLSEDQRGQIRMALHSHAGPTDHDRPGEHPGAEGPQHAGESRHGAKVLSAFKEDRFVLDDVAPAKDMAKKVGKMVDRVIRLAEVAVPVLTAEQRATAAQKLRERANAIDAAGPELL
jgi:Spy/CpxP family protein refolding chaperone